MQITGTVSRISENKAFIITERKSACGENCSGCGACGDKLNEIEAVNEIGAKKGDKVLVEMSDSRVIGAAFLVYIVPLMIFIAMYFMFLSFGFSENKTIILSLLPTVLFYVILYFTDKKSKEKYIHKIIRIIN